MITIKIIVHNEVFALQGISLFLQSVIIFPGIIMDNTAIPAPEISMPAFILSSGITICISDKITSSTESADSTSPAQ